MTKIHNPHDRYFRTLMASSEVAQEFIEKHLPNEIKNILDLKSLQLQHNSYIDEVLHEQIVDLLYSADFGGSSGYIYVLVEHQSTPDKLMPFRMLKYMVAIMEDHLAKSDNNNTLPIVYPIIMYSGTKSYNYSTNLFDLFADKELAMEILWQSCQLVDISVMTDAEFDGFVWYGLMAKAMKYIHKYQKDIISLIEWIMPELQKIENSGRINYVFTTIKYFFEVGEAPNQDEFRDVIQRGLTKSGDEIMTFAEQLRTEGYDKGILAGIIKGKMEGEAKGEAKGKAEVALRLLQQKIAPTIIAEWTGISLDEILKLKQSIKS